ncbi:MAG: regulatory iron-sulfur-containing complex subunit RicT [Candidatus Falkowbacteria bacterium]
MIIKDFSMKAVQVQFASWDKKYNFDTVGWDIKIGDQVVVKNELGVELGRVVGFSEAPDVEEKKEPETEVEEIKKIIRKATAMDLEKLPNEKQKKKDFTFCRKLIDKYQLSMKLVDVHYSLDGSRVTFPFIADTRVDFRELVKDLTKHFSRSIRLQQIGIRDEARFCGDFGHCGRSLCCSRFLGDLNSITSEMAELQQCVHRGSERISGICGRLMCCLAYEEDGYKKLAEKLPEIDSRVKIEGRKGRVLARYILKQTVKVLLDEVNGEAGGVIEAEAGKIKKI